ncbi:hypothetical protein [Coprobacter sp.]
MKRFLLYVLVSFCTGLSVYSQKGFQYLFCGNTLTRTYMQESDDNRTNIEILLNRQAKLSKIELSAGLLSGWFLENLSDFPVNFSNQSTQSFIVSDGNNKHSVVMTVRQIKTRSIPFNLNFSSSYPISVWNLSTTGWAGCGIRQAATGEIELSSSGSAFLMAFTGNGELLSFDVKCPAGTAFSGIFSIESSRTGIDDWSPVKIIDNCNCCFTGAVQRMRLRLPSGTSFLRFVLNEGENVQPVLLNAFSVGAYNGEPVDNEPAALIPVDTSERYVVYDCRFDTMRFSENILNQGYNFRIEDLSGRLFFTGNIFEPCLSLGFLPSGCYVLTGMHKGQMKFSLKFVKVK